MFLQQELDNKNSVFTSFELNPDHNNKWEKVIEWGPDKLLIGKTILVSLT